MELQGLDLPTQIKIRFAMATLRASGGRAHRAHRSSPFDVQPIKKPPTSGGTFIGGATGTRTLGLFHAMEAL